MQKIDADVLLLEACDFKNFPQGGQLSFARQLMTAFGPRFALVGVSTDDSPVGKWIRKEFDGIIYYFFGIGRRNPLIRKPLIPSRLSAMVQLKYYEKDILSSGVSNIFTQAPEMLWIASTWDLKNICYMFPGVNNPLHMPRYKFGKIFARLFDYITFKSLNRVNLILACADDQSIQQLIFRSNSKLNIDRIVKFPTRVDTNIFYPIDMLSARRSLDLPIDKTIILYVGRLNKVKGWDFILNSFICFLKYKKNSLLVFVGDGEDKSCIESEIVKNGLNDKVLIAGQKTSEKVSNYLNASDICVIGSVKEGWSMSMLEALATGKPLVSTDVSGASEMIKEGENGFVVHDRNPELFSEAMFKALRLKYSKKISVSLANKYSTSNLARDLGALWPPLS
jgi:glycosyltransferase involved in cell wall biosynthesis